MIATFINIAEINKVEESISGFMISFEMALLFLSLLELNRFMVSGLIIKKEILDPDIIANKKSKIIIMNKQIGIPMLKL